jgi:outer membrane receptor protein involved in Fe transport
MRTAARLVTLLLTPLGLLAQDTSDDESVVELSPFQVNSSEDQGYYSSQTLAGGRLQSDLNDVATSVQVVTAEMLEDIGAVGLDEVLVYTTNTDVAGQMSMYTASEDTDGGGTLSSQGSRQDPGNANRVRGLGAATRTANYFETSIPTDSYNSSRIDINRGANSFLFGLGSPGGIINANPDQAIFKNSNRVNVRFSTENFENNFSTRASFNINRQLVKDRLALRVAAVTSEDEYAQLGASKDEERYYGAIKFKPFADKHVIFRANYEEGDVSAVPVDRLAPLESLSNFITDPLGTQFNTPTGRISIDAYNNIIANSAINGRAGYLGVDANGVPVPLIYNQTIKNRGWTIMFDDTINADGHPTWSTQSGWTNNFIRRGNPVFDPDNNLRGNNQSALARVIRTSELGGDFVGFTSQGVTNYDVFDFRRNLLTGPLDSYANDFDRLNLALEMVSKNRDFGVEIGYNKETWTRDSFVAIGVPEINIDINKTLPVGMLPSDGVNPGGGNEMNPNYGRLYLGARTASRADYIDDREAIRATAFGKFDFEEKYGDSPLSWLGRHTVTGLLDHNEYYQQRNDFRQFIFGNDAGFHLNQPDATRFQRQTATHYYISPAFPEAFTDPNFQVSDFFVTGMDPRINLDYPVGFSIPLSYLSQGNPDTDASRNRPRGDERPAVAEFQPIWSPTSGSLVQTTVESYALNMQSSLFNDLLVANLGWREDSVDIIRNTEPPRTDEQVPILDPDGFNLDGIDPRTVKSNVFAYGLVAKVPDQWLPEGTSVSFHYGDSENFVPNPGGFTWEGNPVPSASGSTEEYGVSVSLMQNKLHARLNFYEGAVRDEPYLAIDRAYKLIAQQDVLSPRRDLFEDLDIYDQDRDGVLDLVPNPDDPNGPMIDPDLNKNGYLDSVEAADPNFELNYLSLADLTTLESGFDQLVNPWAAETGGLTLTSGANTADGEPVTAQGNGLFFTLSDTVDLEAEGMEFELTYNPTQNLRLSANVTQQESRTSNVAANTTILWERLLAIYRSTPKSSRAPRGRNKLENELGADPLQTGTMFESYVLNPNKGQVYLAQRALSGSDNPEVREYRVNVLGNYTFSEGRLAGTKIGAAYRWQDQAAAGYTMTVDPEYGLPVKDVSNPYFDETNSFVDFWIGYRVKAFGDKVTWKIQLNVRNVFADNDPVAVQFQPDGSIARVAVPVPRQFILSNTFSF